MSYSYHNMTLSVATIKLPVLSDHDHAAFFLMFLDVFFTLKYNMLRICYVVTFFFHFKT